MHGLPPKRKVGWPRTVGSRVRHQDKMQVLSPVTGRGLDRLQGLNQSSGRPPVATPSRLKAPP